MTAKKVLTDEMKERALKFARLGLSMEHISQALGMAKATFRLLREADPDFNAAVYKAFAEHAIELQTRLMTTDDPAEAAAWQKLLAHRFPAQYGNDPRLGRIENINDDRYAEDINPVDGESKSTSRLEDAINALLDSREGGKE